ncbi:MAG: Cysteine-tRNA ligase [Candidatus Daviesbacteria bacterium GW2011_GWA1_41_61]|uniref:Cysteine--tRNA ligase n=1 Tax=Candidatus Daviesbacteria bacterium GW2011_GWA2_40_9 TaxID=1618424 RepID=A0A0G0X6H7_9BACT|nr:MAG: cysteinyl-tRNA synthetase, cysteinyl-tRNA synthetase [Candidatus Daviesbacteria bacterium GW2011_GWC1_40_9]KKR83232.1 MAG: Cysteine-tRNA ligase [Candidatus Daviesbacteria bacterium GW2011_GWA2_40_9]KKR93577.1 MAG: Cysteine-tRNA ligase [Candidatus Daviesbacteria bacterium GW2011_GWB1_41_15]KKS14872.1 MAG: Cysteine-tRNA ligase [Candidatus Daviesbacteria bacterium GW2011_GWA1_41_61]
MTVSLKLYNTLTRQVEEFKPLNPPHVGMYTCGPTVHDFAHIGNLRTFIFEDLLQKVLEAEGYKVVRVMNLTDIEDKIIKKAKEKGVSLEEFTTPYELAFFEDLRKLNIKYADIYPKATEHIGGMVKYIEVLVKKGLAYVAEDGSVYFDISKFPEYGKLSQLDKREVKAGARVKADEYSKEDVQDFALWKSVDPGEVGYDSPWGRGRPGWHIECSVMSQQYLGETFDIHGGAVDLIFPHHENEIAQSEGKTGKQFSMFFVEGEHLLVNGQKMAKSLKNYFTLRDIEAKGFEPLALRYLALTAHYRDKLNFTWKSLQAAQNALNNLREEVRDWDQSKIGCAEYERRFFNAVDNDLNVPQALAILWELVKSDYPTSAKAESLLKFDKILGLKLDEYLGKPLEVPEEVQKLVDQREKVRKNKDFQKSDELRDEIKKMGYEMEDTPTGPKVKKVL